MLLAATLGCRTARLQPVDLDASDMCALCKMAITETRYAAEVLDKDGGVFKFDNLDCMGRFVTDRQLKDKTAAYFVRDYDGAGWLKAEGAGYVKSARIPSPMDSGLAAFASRARAEQFAAQYEGKTLTFQELWNR